MGTGPHDRQGHPAQGNQAHPYQPVAQRRCGGSGLSAAVEHAQPRRETSVLAHGGGFRRVLRIHRRPGGAGHRLPGTDRTARQHRRLLLRRQRRLRRRVAERLGQREQILQRLPRRPCREHEVHRPARHSRYLQSLPHGVGRRVLHAVPDVQTLLTILRWHLRPISHPLAQGNQGQGRGASPISPRHRHCADNLGRGGADDAGDVSRRRPISRQRRIHAIHV